MIRYHHKSDKLSN